VKVAVTGHRPTKLGYEFEHVGPYTDALKLLFTDFFCKNDVELAITGMALGVDQIFAVCAIRCKVPVLACLPCPEQSERWSKKAQADWNMILRHRLVTYEVVSKAYTPKCMQQRNEFMVDACDLLLAVWDESGGGTAKCVHYADRVDVPRATLSPQAVLDGERFGCALTRR